MPVQGSLLSMAAPQDSRVAAVPAGQPGLRDLTNSAARRAPVFTHRFC